MKKVLFSKITKAIFTLIYFVGICSLYFIPTIGIYFVATFLLLYSVYVYYANKYEEKLTKEVEEQFQSLMNLINGQKNKQNVRTKTR